MMTPRRNKIKTKKLLKQKETSRELRLPRGNGKRKINFKKKSSKRMKDCIKRQFNRNSEKKNKQQLKKDQLHQQLQMTLLKVNKTCFKQMHLVLMDSSQMLRTQRRMKITWYCHQSLPTKTRSQSSKSKKASSKSKQTPKSERLFWQKQ